MKQSLNNKAYNSYDNIDKNFLHDINGELFYFNPSWKKVGVNLSGGADSACGLAILCKLITELNCNTEIVVISHVRGWINRPWQRYIFVDVFNKIKSMYPNVSMQQIKSFIPPELEAGSLGKIDKLNAFGDVVIVSSFNIFATSEYKLEAVYNFTTLNPVKEDLKNYITENTKSVNDWMNTSDRVWSEDKLDTWISTRKYPPQYQLSIQKFSHLYNKTSERIFPWLLLKKDFVLNQFYKNGWEDLLNTTRSCEGDYSNLYDSQSNEIIPTYIHKETKLITCTEKNLDNPCFWCVERQWAKESVKKDNDK